MRYTISRFSRFNSSRCHAAARPRVRVGISLLTSTILIALAGTQVHAQSDRYRQPDYERQVEPRPDSSGRGGYDRQSDRWRPPEPSGNAFEQDEPDPFGAAPTTRIKPRAAQDDELVVRDLSEPSGGPGSLKLGRNAWNGLTRASLLDLARNLPYPIASPTLAELFRDLLVSQEIDARGEAGLDALRAELLYRSGMVDAVEQLARQKTDGPDRPIVEVTRAKSLLAAGAVDAACQTADRIDREARVLARQSRRDAFSLAAYCAAFQGDKQAASRIMRRAEKMNVNAPVPSAIVDMLASGRKPDAPVPKRLKLIDYKFLQLAKARATERIVALGEPALLVSVARDTSVPADIRSLALDKAIEWSALNANEVAAIVRAITDRVRKGKSVGVAEILSKSGNASPTQFQELAASLIVPSQAFALAPIVAREAGDAARAKLAPEALGAIVKLLVAAGDVASAEQIVRRASQQVGRPDAETDNWLTFINIADGSGSVEREAGLAASASLARRGLMSPTTMHRLVTVLDALGYNVPIPLWEAANRTAQPVTGFLPETGVLARLRQAARKREQGKTILLAMTAIGKAGPAETNLIALTDVIRALRRIGLEPAARRLAIEALWPVWPKKGRRMARQLR